MNVNQQSIARKSGIRLLFISICSILVGETLIMLLLSALPPLSIWVEAFVDSILLGILIIPVLYFLMVRPLVIHLTERKRAEELLKSNELRFHTVADFTNDMEYWEDENKKIVYISPSSEKITGYRQDEFISDPLLTTKIVHPDDVELKIKHREEAYLYQNRNNIADLEFRIIRKDNSIVNVYHVCRPIFNEDGIFLGRRISNRDITERKRAEEALRQNEENLSLTLHSIGDGVISTDSKGIITRMNPVAEKLCNWQIDDAKGKLLSEVFKIINANNREPISNPFEKVMKTGKVVGLENHTILISHDGSERNISDSAAPIKGSAGNIEGVVIVFSDVTESYKGRKLLSESEERYRSIFETAVEGIWGLDKNNITTFVNKRMAEMLGYKSENMIGKSFEYFIQTEALIDYHTKMEERRKGKSDIFERRYIRKDGSTLWVIASVTPMFDSDGEFKGSFGMLTDITERKRVEEALHHRLTELETLFSISSALTKTESFEKTLQVVLGKTIEAVNADAGVLFSLDETTQKLECFAAYGNLSSMYGMTLNIEEGVCGYVAQSLVPYPFVDLAKDDKTTTAMRSKIQGDLGGMCMPIIFEGRLLGTFMVCKEENKYFEPDEIQLLITICNIVASAIDSANKYSNIVSREEKLQKSEKKYRDLIEHAVVGIYATSLTGDFFYTNDALWKMLEYESADEFKYLGAKAMYKNIEDRERLIETIREKEQILNYEVELITKTRKIRNMIISAYMTGDLLTGMVMDITDRKLAEENLRQSEEQFRLISENVADLIAVLDLEGRRVYNSPMYKNIIGDPKDLLGTDSFQEIHPDDREKIRAIFQETVRTGIGQRTEYRFINKNGTISHIESQGSVIRDKNGKVTNVVVVSRDVTEKKLLDQQFMRMQRMESIGTLAGGIAHDLNNVLAPIMLSIEILKRAIPDERSQKILETIETSAHRGAAIVKQILGFARGVQGEEVPIQFRHIINEITNIIKETFPKSIKIIEDIPKDIWTIVGDPTNLHQLLLNMCVNARDAMPDGGTINIKAENKVIDEHYSRMHLEAKPGRFVMLSVEDTGCGIPPAVLERIFEPFFTTKEVGKGTGLGLSTVNAIVKSHGGFVNVYSEVGKGTTFRVYLPTAKATGEIQPKLEKLREMFLGHGELIMVVDDESSIQQITKHTLEAHGYRVITASDGTEAVANFASKKEEIALVLTDMMMPIMDGPRTIHVLRKMKPLVKIIASSGLTGNGHVVTDKELGVNAFLVKPYNAEKLLEAVHSVLHKES